MSTKLDLDAIEEECAKATMAVISVKACREWIPVLVARVRELEYFLENINKNETLGWIGCRREARRALEKGRHAVDCPRSYVSGPTDWKCSCGAHPFDCKGCPDCEGIK